MSADMWASPPLPQDAPSDAERETWGVPPLDSGDEQEDDWNWDDDDDLDEEEDEDEDEDEPLGYERTPLEDEGDDRYEQERDR